MEARRACRVLPFALGLSLSLSACGTSPTASEPTRSEPSTSEPTSSEQESSMTTPARPDDPASLAATDLAERLDTAVDAVTVVSVEEVTWRDSALGCPEPGRMYAQGLVDGHRIVLSAAGEEYEYHSGGTREPFLCEDPQPPA